MTFVEHRSLFLLFLFSFRLLPDYRSTIDLFLTVEVSCGLDTHTNIYIHSLFLVTTGGPNICRTFPSLPWYESQLQPCLMIRTSKRSVVAGSTSLKVCYVNAPRVGWKYYPLGMMVDSDVQDYCKKSNFQTPTFHIFSDRRGIFSSFSYFLFSFSLFSLCLLPVIPYIIGPNRSLPPPPIFGHFLLCVSA